MIDDRFFHNVGPFSVGALSDIVHGEVRGDECMPINNLGAVLDVGSPNAITFYVPGRHQVNWTQSRFSACIVSPEDVETLPQSITCIMVSSPYRAFCAIARVLYPNVEDYLIASSQDYGVHENASIGPNVHLSPGVVVAEDAEIGEGACIGPNVTIGRGVKIGKYCKIHANVTLMCSLIGNSVTILPGTCVGQAGFGFKMTADGPIDLPQLGRVIIDDNVSIGANSTIDRGSLKDTKIGAHTRIDNLVQIAHGVELGVGCIVVAQVGIAGGTRVGDFSALAGQAGVAEHLEIGKGARVAAQSGVMRSVPAGETVGGSPAVPITEWRRQCVTLSRLARKK